jgi:hypothetical protein
VKPATGYCGWTKLNKEKHYGNKDEETSEENHEESFEADLDGRCAEEGSAEEESDEEGSSAEEESGCQESHQEEISLRVVPLLLTASHHEKVRARPGVLTSPSR